jgi:hypothetical protein
MPERDHELVPPTDRIAIPAAKSRDLIFATTSSATGSQNGYFLHNKSNNQKKEENPNFSIKS